MSSAFSVGFKTEKKELQLIWSWSVKCDSCENVSLGICNTCLSLATLFSLSLNVEVRIYRVKKSDRILFETLQNTNSLKIFSHHVQMYVELQSQYFIGSFIFLIFSVKDKIWNIPIGLKIMQQMSHQIRFFKCKTLSAYIQIYPLFF